MYSQLPLDTITSILRKNDVEFAGIFGSFARGDERPDSDLDILIRYGKEKSLIDLIGLEQELESALQRKVDVVTESAVNKYIRPYVMKDLQILYGERR